MYTCARMHTCTPLPARCGWSVCARAHSHAHKQSDEGYYGDPGVSATECPAGAYCPAGVDQFVPCPANTTSPPGAARRAKCVALPGWYGEPGAAAAECPRNWYCPAGAASPVGCPANTLSAAGSDDAKDCKASIPPVVRRRVYPLPSCGPCQCASTLLSGRCSDSALFKGRFRWPLAPFDSIFSLTRTDSRPQAAPGFQGLWGTDASQCDAGFYCPTGAQVPRPCPNFTTSPQDSSAVTDCKARGNSVLQAGL